MDVLLRDVPEQVVITEQRMVDQAALESWLPGAMSRVHKAAGDAAAGTVGQPYSAARTIPDEPVFIVIYEGNPNEGETAVECCTPLQAGVPAPADAASRAIPAHREAYVRVTKSTVESGHIGDVYMAIEQWIGGERAGHRGRSARDVLDRLLCRRAGTMWSSTSPIPVR